MKTFNTIGALSFFALCLLQGACSGKSADKGDSKQEGEGADASTREKAKNSPLAIDGSSTVYPITEAVAEEFGATNKARVTIGVSGTGGGFKKFCKKETAITGASRPIKPTEVKMCGDAKVEYIELPVAYDGIAVVTHPKNDWASSMTVEELKALWRPEAAETVKKWSDIREGWPDKEIHLFGPGVDSGTYDYFTKAIVGKEHSSRGDFTSSEDDNVLVQGISTDPDALGFFGFAYYAENKDSLNLVPIDDGKADNGAGPIAPSLKTVGDGSYQPLSRPIFIYVNKDSMSDPQVKSFVDFYLKNAADLSKEVGYIPLPPEATKLVQDRLSKGITGSLFEGSGSKVGVTVEELLAKQ